MSTERNIDDYYETNIRRFDPEMNKMFGMYRRHLAYLRPGMRVLEIGPGNGGFSAYIRGTFGLKSEDFTLLDISHTVVEALRANPETSSFHIEESDVVDFLERE
ncbi:MAG TPA: hypothetical protein PK765_03860 [bacterium]|nr:hypothetical protein [bacterium]